MYKRAEMKRRESTESGGWLVSPVSSGTTESRPLIAWIFSDDEALEQYHETYSRFISECIESGWLEEEIARVQEMITPYLEQDASAFYSMEEFEKAVSTLKTFCAKRGESVRGQLDGTIPSTSNGQRSSDALIDASDISTADMGSMNSTNGSGGGPDNGFGGGMPSGMPDMSSMPDMSTMPDMGSMPDAGGGQMPSGMPDVSSMPDMSDRQRPSGMPDAMGNFSGSTGNSSAADPESPAASPDIPAGSETAAPDPSAEPEAAEPAEQPAEGSATERPEPPEGGFSGGGPGGDFPGGNFGGAGGYSSGIWIWTAACAAGLLAAVLIIRKIGNHNS